MAIRQTHVGTSEGISLQVTKVSSMSFLPKGTSMLSAARIEVLSCCFHPTSKVSKLMDMKPMLAVRVESLDRAGDADWLVGGGLAEGDDSASIGLVGIEDTDGVAT